MEGRNQKVNSREIFNPALVFGVGFFYLLVFGGVPSARGEDWESGDIVMRHGTGLWSEFFRKYSVRDRRFSHAGIVWVEGGKLYCIHAEGDDLSGRGQVAKVPLREFFKPSRANGHFRFRLPREVRLRCAREAHRLLGVPFDWKFDTDDHSALYCTELIAVALSGAAPQIFLKRCKNIIPLDALSDPSIAEELSARLP